MGAGVGLKMEVGIYWSPTEFVDQAMKCTHPYDREVAVPPRVAAALYNQAILGPDGVAVKRSEALEYYRWLGAELEEKELKLHSKLCPQVAEVIKDKKVLLFKQMLLDIGYDDLGVVDLLKFGIETVGHLPRIGIWKQCQKPPLLGVETLWEKAPEVQKQVMHYKDGGPEDEEVWKLTLAERDEGGIRGPFTPKQVSMLLGPRWTAARRFAVVQGTKETPDGPVPKVRPIDDFSEHGVNKAFGHLRKSVCMVSIT